MLVYNEDESVSDGTKLLRELYLNNLDKIGLKIVKLVNGRRVYVKIFASFHMLLQAAEEIKMKIPVMGFNKEQLEYENIELVEKYREKLKSLFGKLNETNRRIISIV